MKQKLRNSKESLKELRLQLQALTEELEKTTEYLQLIEIEIENKPYSHDMNQREEISSLVRKQNVISSEIIRIRKNIKKLSSRTIFKAELIVLSLLLVVLFYTVMNFYSQTNDALMIKIGYLIENLRVNITDTWKYWSSAKEGTMVVLCPFQTSYVYYPSAYS